MAEKNLTSHPNDFSVHILSALYMVTGNIRILEYSDGNFLHFLLFKGAQSLIRSPKLGWAHWWWSAGGWETNHLLRGPCAFLDGIPAVDWPEIAGPCSLVQIRHSKKMSFSFFGLLEVSSSLYKVWCWLSASPSSSQFPWHYYSTLWSIIGFT